MQERVQVTELIQPSVRTSGMCGSQWNHLVCERKGVGKINKQQDLKFEIWTRCNALLAQNGFSLAPPPHPSQGWRGQFRVYECTCFLSGTKEILNRCTHHTLSTELYFQAVFQTIAKTATQLHGGQWWPWSWGGGGRQITWQKAKHFNTHSFSGDMFVNWHIVFFLMCMNSNPDPRKEGTSWQRFIIHINKTNEVKICCLLIPRNSDRPH